MIKWLLLYSLFKPQNIESILGYVHFSCFYGLVIPLKDLFLIVHTIRPSCITNLHYKYPGFRSIYSPRIKHLSFCILHPSTIWLISTLLLLIRYCSVVWLHDTVSIHWWLKIFSYKKNEPKYIYCLSSYHGHRLNAIMNTSICLFLPSPSSVLSSIHFYSSFIYRVSNNIDTKTIPLDHIKAMDETLFLSLSQGMTPSIITHTVYLLYIFKDIYKECNETSIPHSSQWGSSSYFFPKW